MERHPSTEEPETLPTQSMASTSSLSRPETSGSGESDSPLAQTLNEDQEMVPVPSTAASPSAGPSVSEEDETSGRGDLGGAEPGPAVFLDPVPSGSGGEARCSSKSYSEAPQKNKRLQCTCGYSRIRQSELQCMKAKCLELKAQTDELMEKNILLARQSEKLQAVLLLLGVTADEFEEDIPEEELIPEEPEAE